jgi:pimeloyl-ACP methyl ester carboxylesterase
MSRIASAVVGLLLACASAEVFANDLGLQTPLPQPPAVTEGLAELGNVRLWYWDTGGNGETVLLLHPGSGSSEFYPYQQAAFAKAGYRVISYSRRGQFKSEAGTDLASFHAVDDLLALMDHLKVDRAHLIGNALGAYVALEAAILRPVRVRTLTLASSMLGIDEPEYQAALRSLRPAPFAELPETLKEVGPSYRAANPAGLEEWRTRQHRAGKGAPVRPKNKITWSAVAGLKVPTLLMTGDADLWIPPYLLQQVAKKFPNAETVIVPDTGHAIQWEKPDAFNTAVLRFIGRSKR